MEGGVGEIHVVLVGADPETSKGGVRRGGACGKGAVRDRSQEEGGRPSFFFSKDD